MMSQYNEGTRYPPHVDAPIDGSSDFRVTVIYFLAPPTQGGELRVFTPQYDGRHTGAAGSGTEHGIAGVDAMDIEPRADRMVLLLSRGVVHQVLPTRGTRRRLLLTAWWRTQQLDASSGGGGGGGKLEKSNGNVCVRRSGVAIGGARTRMAKAEAEARAPVSAHAKAETAPSTGAGETVTDGGPRLH